MNSTEQAHNNLRNVLLNGRILLNGNPLTAVESTQIIQGEQMLFEKATKIDQQEQAAKLAKESSQNKKPH